MKIESARIVTASPMELVIISYEVIFDDINEAKEAIKTNQLDIMKNKLKNANDFISNLSESLNMNYEISYDLKRLYDYIHKTIIETMINKNLDKVDEVEKILKKLYASFNTILKEENDKKTVMSNYEKIYSGLTYGVNGLNETVIGNENKGIRV